jgi:tetratricopeptide (TPR) repeat protein
LREAFGQLAQGVNALHGHGMLHRDLKPSNVLVTKEGRVVILDFGLITHLETEGAAEMPQFLGSPAYMSPEQCAELPASPASDWYSVGVMLYQALTGELPFPGTVYQMIAARLRGEPTSPMEVAGGVPEDLSRLCMDLLRPEPEERPDGAQVLARLGGASAAPEASPAAPAPGGGSIFVGRDDQLASLREALGHVQKGRGVSVHLRGRSGMGKTSLARRFVAEVRESDEGALVLFGRCFRRESVPYKAVDSLVDALARHLATLPPDEAKRLLPREWQALARLFPVLKDVGAAVSGDTEEIHIPDANELRRRGFGALRAILTKLGRERTVILFVDDIQWGDVDSGVLLREIMRPPQPPPLFFMVSYRSDEADRSELIRLLAEGEDEQIPHWDVDVGELSAGEARALALARLGDDGREARARADVLVRESGGSPFFVDELARHVRAAGDSDLGGIDLDSVFERRLRQLPADARRLLDIIAAAGRPVDLRVANQAAGLDPRDMGAIEVLRSRQWVRERLRGGGDVYETYHDRIREAVKAAASEDVLSAYHDRLAAALEASGVADAETLAEHYQRAGDLELAGRHAVRAADQAAAALAFDRAARLYEQGIEDWNPQGSERFELLVQMARALTNAGRGGEAARTLLMAAEVAPPGEVRDLTRPAARHFLVSGLIDEGLGVLRSVLEDAGMRMARTPRRALLSLLVGRARLALRGLDFQPRRASEVDPDLLAKIDVCWAVAVGLGMVDLVRSADFQARNLLLSLRAGEPFRATRALLMEYAFSAGGGGRSKARTHELRSRCKALVEEIDQPYLWGLHAVLESLDHNLSGRWIQSLESGRRAEQILRERCTGVTWELDTAQLYQVHSILCMGRFRELGRRAPAMLEDAVQRGDQYLATYVRSRNLYLLHLAADDPETARRLQARSLEGWSGRGFQIQHYFDFYARSEIELYDGRPHEALEMLHERWGAYRRSLLRRSQGLDMEPTFLRVRCGIAAAARGGDQKRLLRAVAKDLRRMRREKMEWWDAMATLGQAGVASITGEGSTLDLLTEAHAAAEALDLEHFAHAALWRRGQLTPGTRGREMIRRARTWMRSQGVENPERMVGMLAPGSWG